MKELQYILEWLSLLAVQRLVWVLPRRVVLTLAEAAGEILYRFRLRRQVVLANLATAFPEWTDVERRNVARRVYHNTARVTVESMLLSRLTDEEIEAMVESTDGSEHLERVRGEGRPFIAVSGHVGNWELLGHYFARKGYPIKTLMKPLHNRRVNDALVSIRRAAGLDVLSTGEGLRPALQHLEAGGVLAFLADQDARRAGIAMPFFGVPASTARGPAFFALKHNVPILPVFVWRSTESQYRFSMFPPLERREGEDSESALVRMTREHVKALEQVVRANPDQYFWFHRRWKTPERKIRGMRLRRPAAADTESRERNDVRNTDNRNGHAH